MYIQSVGISSGDCSSKCFPVRENNTIFAHGNQKSCFFSKKIKKTIKPSSVFSIKRAKTKAKTTHIFYNPTKTTQS